ncbi:Crp/Fnr family transcriptional regulator [Halochromatium glycolicum]|uniref:Crp/Fnr family transcriptional regulator n=1 Tax=Halochromatium glycolicum TaxID=85075 RepID=A0AAJ0XBB4_9GAMM|nr:Crp/Fnr family transcriptional regulator [Halochromatium glycolicum]MBK1706626.1 Crp/Fnr family transcriptional regulator [Halochromatium glycolicum]
MSDPISESRNEVRIDDHDLVRVKTGTSFNTLPRSLQAAELRQAPLFTALSPAQLDRLLQRANRARLAPGQLLFRQDESAERFYFVRFGQMRLFRLSSDGDEKIIELIRAGQTFAEGLLFMGTGRYPVCAAALTEAEVVGIDAADFAAMLRDSPDTCFALLGDLSRRLHSMIAEIDSLTLLSAQGRVARWLLHNSRPDEPSLRLSVSKSVLASRLSIQPETWSRVTRRLSEQGLIEVEGDRIAIRDRATLNLLADEV